MQEIVASPDWVITVATPGLPRIFTRKKKKMTLSKVLEDMEADWWPCLGFHEAHVKS